MTARWLSALPITRLRTIAAQPSGSSVRRYCSRRSSTLPETGPSTRARNLPCSVRKVTATPSSAQKPSSGGLRLTRPKPTRPPSVWIGTRARSAPSIATTTLAPSLLRYAPWVVT